MLENLSGKIDEAISVILNICLQELSEVDIKKTPKSFVSMVL